MEQAGVDAPIWLWTIEKGVCNLTAIFFFVSWALKF